MCLKQEHRFSHKDIEKALEMLQLGWAVAFERGAYNHFCIYLGTCLVSKFPDGRDLEPHKEGESPLRHVICQLTKRRDRGLDGRGDIWIDDFKAAARDSSILVYECNCSASKRAAVVEQCLKCQGETEYSLQNNNCEHFVRHMLEGKSDCLQKLKFGKLFKDRSLPTSLSSSWSRELYGFAKDAFVFLLRDKGEAVKASVELRNPQQLLRLAYAKIHPLTGEKTRFAEFTEIGVEPQAIHTPDRAKGLFEPETVQLEPRLRSYTQTSPQGFCLVINICKYDASTGLKSRPRSSIDVKRIKEVFEELDYAVRTEEDLKTHQIYKLLNDIASDERLFQHGCFLCFLMGHGTKDLIYGSDGEPLELQSVTQIFSPSVCPGLRGKPKIFFLQTDRNEELDLFKAASPAAAKQADLQSLTAKGSDFVLCTSSFGDADESLHSSFVQRLCSEIESNRKEAKIMKIITSVNKQVIENGVRASSIEDEAAPDLVSTLTKSFFFRHRNRDE